MVGRVAAGALAAALPTAAGLLLVISASISHDLLDMWLVPEITERGELLAAGAAVLVAGYFGISPPGFVAQVVTFSFGLAAASFFPAIIMSIFFERMNKYGAVSGMIVGITATAGYIIYVKLLHPEINNADHWLFGISPEGIGTLGMLLNMAVAVSVAQPTPPPSAQVQAMVDEIRNSDATR